MAAQRADTNHPPIADTTDWRIPTISANSELTSTAKTVSRISARGTTRRQVVTFGRSAAAGNVVLWCTLSVRGFGLASNELTPIRGSLQGLRRRLESGQLERRGSSPSFRRLGGKRSVRKSMEGRDSLIGAQARSELFARTREPHPKVGKLALSVDRAPERAVAHPRPRRRFHSRFARRRTFPRRLSRASRTRQNGRSWSRFPRREIAFQLRIVAKLLCVETLVHDITRERLLDARAPKRRAYSGDPWPDR